MSSAKRRTRRAQNPRMSTWTLSPPPRSPRRREFHSVDFDCSLGCILSISAHDTHVYLSCSISSSGRYIFLRIGSNTNGLLNPVLDVAVLVISDRIPVGPSFLPLSYSRAIFWRKLTACHAIVSVHQQTLAIDTETYRLGEPSCPTNLEPTQVATSRGRAHDDIRILLDFLVRNSLIYSNLRTVSHHCMSQHRVMTYRIVLSMNGESGNSNGSNRICR